MTKPRITRETLLKKAFDLFSTQGYHRTSIQDIADACQLTKASIYHHITSKEALALDLIRDLREQYDSHFIEMLDDQEISRSEKMTRFFNFLSKHFEKDKRSCMLTKFLSELQPDDGQLWVEIKGFCTKTVDAILKILPEGDTDEMLGHATRIFGLTQSTMLLNKVWPGQQHFDTIHEYCQAAFYPPVEIA